MSIRNFMSVVAYAAACIKNEHLYDALIDVTDDEDNTDQKRFNRADSYPKYPENATRFNFLDLNVLVQVNRKGDQWELHHTTSGQHATIIVSSANNEGGFTGRYQKQQERFTGRVTSEIVEIEDASGKKVYRLVILP